MFGLFKNNLTNSGFLKGSMDWHSHILYGVDDGAKTVADSQEMIAGLKSLGFRGAYCTPHIMAGYPENTSTRLRERFEGLLAQVNLDEFELQLAAEYMLDEQFLEKLDKEHPLTYDGQRILVELPQIALPRNWQEMIFQLKSQGYIPVMAHPERYWHLLKDEQDKEILQEGCEFQLNILSLGDYYSRGVGNQAWELIKSASYCYFGSDVHRFSQIGKMQNIKIPAKKMLLLAKKASHFLNLSLQALIGLEIYNIFQYD